MASAISAGKGPPERAKPIRQPGNRRDDAVGNFPTLTIISVASLPTSVESRAAPGRNRRRCRCVIVLLISAAKGQDMVNAAYPNQVNYW
jgi:hypothetical protein